MKKLLVLSTGVVSLAAAGIMIVPNLAQAQSGNGNRQGFGYEQALTSKAQALNMTKEQLQEQLKTKTMHEIVADKGISEDAWHQKMQTAAQERWKANGLSQEEIDSRLKTMQERQANCDGTGEHAGTGGMGYGRNR